MKNITMKFDRIIGLTMLMIFVVANRVLAQEPSSEPSVKNPPVIIESLVGNRGVSYQAIVIKNFQSIPELGFFSVSTLVPQWKEGTFNDMMNQVNLTYRVIPNTDIAVGMMYTPFTGFLPSAGLIYSKGSPSYTIVIAPRIDLARNSSSEVFTLAEYKPSLNDKLRIYTRVQLLYALMTDSGDHARSYVVGRAGIKYREFAFGVGGNFDWYGSAKQNINNIGAFITIALF